MLHYDSLRAIQESIEDLNADWMSLYSVAKSYEDLLIKCATQSAIARKLIAERYPELIPEKVFDGEAT